MPRIYDGNSDPYDYCLRCFPSEAQAVKKHGAGEGPDGRGNCFSYNDDHPDYDGEDYKCEKCRKSLTAKGN